MGGGSKKQRRRGPESHGEERSLCVNVPLGKMRECDRDMESDDAGVKWRGVDRAKAQYRPSQGDRNKSIKMAT